MQTLYSTKSGYHLRPLAAVQENPTKSNQRIPIPDESPATRLDKLLQKTPRDVNVLTEIADQIEILCNADNEETRSNSGEADVHNEKDEARDSAPPADEDAAETTDGEALQEERKMAARRALLSRSGKGTPRSASTRANSRTSTSVGEKRVGSATRARQKGSGVTKRFMDAVRISASPYKPKDGNDNSQNPDANTAPKASVSTPLNEKITPSGIHSAVLDLLERQRKANSGDGAVAPPGPLNWNQPPELLQPPSEQPFAGTPPPGTILIPPTVAASSLPKLQFPDCLTVRVAHGLQAQDTEVAHLRLSVFSDFSPEVRRQLVSRSVNAVVTRRMKGATCLVATVPPSLAARKRNRPPVILGSAECSYHEFEGSTLGARRPAESILYVTEVAVSPNARRRGIGRKLLEAVDSLADLRGVETLYLHVDVDNESALALYEFAGYQRVNKCEPMFLEFTTKLNLHDGATRGRNHYLLYKDLVKCPTWLPEPADATDKSHEASPALPRPNPGTLGFEVPC